jgi:hypothetical protein
MGPRIVLRKLDRGAMAHKVAFVDAPLLEQNRAAGKDARLIGHTRETRDQRPLRSLQDLQSARCKGAQQLNIHPS